MTVEVIVAEALAMVVVEKRLLPPPGLEKVSPNFASIPTIACWSAPLMTSGTVEHVGRHIVWTLRGENQR